MSYAKMKLEKELSCLSTLIEEYKKQLAELPKGRIRERHRGERVYYYLAYRDGKKVINDYLGTDPEQMNVLRSNIDQRDHIKAIVRRLEEEQALVCKALGGLQ